MQFEVGSSPYTADICRFSRRRWGRLVSKGSISKSNNGEKGSPQAGVMMEGDRRLRQTLMLEQQTSGLAYTDRSGTLQPCKGAVIPKNISCCRWRVEPPVHLTNTTPSAGRDRRRRSRGVASQICGLAIEGQPILAEVMIGAKSSRSGSCSDSPLMLAGSAELKLADQD